MSEEKKLNLAQKVGITIIGPVIGLLPPPLQIKLLKSYDAACLASTTSRVFNGAITSYTIVSLVGKTFGADIDTPSLGTILVSADTFVREGRYCLAYYFAHPFANYHEPWGEPFISTLYSKAFPNISKDVK